MFTMPSAVTLRSDCSAAELRRLARRIKNAAQARCLLALAAIHDGGTRSEAARLGHVNLRVVRDWVVRFNAEGPDGLIGRRAPGPTAPLTDRAPPGAGDAGRPRPDPHSLWRGALAAVRSRPMAMGAFRVSVSMQTACTLCALPMHPSPQCSHHRRQTLRRPVAGKLSRTYARLRPFF